MEQWNGKGDGGAVRVERGYADEEELAALTVVLLSALAGRRRASGADGAAERSAAAPWRRWDRVAAYRPPHSWQ